MADFNKAIWSPCYTDRANEGLSECNCPNKENLNFEQSWQCIRTFSSNDIFVAFSGFSCNLTLLVSRICVVYCNIGLLISHNAKIYHHFSRQICSYLCMYITKHYCVLLARQPKMQIRFFSFQRAWQRKEVKIISRQVNIFFYLMKCFYPL
jgi:hypothetical protein